MKFKNLMFATIASLGVCLTSCNIGESDRTPNVPNQNNEEYDANLIDNALHVFYDAAVMSQHFKGTFDEWIKFISGETGDMNVNKFTKEEILKAEYQKAIDSGKYTGTFEEWLKFISGQEDELKPKPTDPNTSSKELYDKAIASGNFKGSYDEWLDLISGNNGALDVQKDEAIELYNKYKENNPNYTKTFEEWVKDVLNNELSSTKSYTVTFNSNGGSEVENQTVLEGKKIIEPTDPIKEGFTFAGWTLNNKIIDFNGFLVTENTVLTASWTINEYTININYGTEKPNETRALKYNSSLTLDDVSKDGYKFLGWFNDDTNEKVIFPLTVKENLNLVARFSDSILINLDTNGGNPLDPLEAKIGSTLNSLPTPTHNSAKFVNWSIIENGVNKEATFPMVINGTNDLTFIANWKETSNDFEYSINNNEITITGYIGTDTDVIIPSVIKNIPVRTLGASTFKNNSKITSVKMSSIKTVEDEALSRCSNLTTVDFGNGVTNYGINTLFNSNKLNTIYFDLNCPLLKLFDYNVSNMPLNMNFKIYYNEDVYESTTFDNLKTLEINDIELLDGFFNAPSFKEMKMKSFKMADSIYHTNREMFKDCTQLKEVKFSNCLEEITSYSFNNCTSLISIIIPESVKEIEFNAFDSCRNLVDIKLPSKLSYIGEGAFKSCKKLAKIDIPDSVSSIQRYAFEGCTSLKELKLPQSLTKLGDTVISNTAIETLVLPSSLKNISLNNLYNSTLAAIYIPKTVTSIDFGRSSDSRNTNSFAIYYEGTRNAWKELSYSNDPVLVNSYKTYYECKSITAVKKQNEYFSYYELAPNELLILDYLKTDVTNINMNKIFPEATYVNLLPLRMFDNQNFNTFVFHDKTKASKFDLFYGAHIQYLNLSNVENMENYTLFNSEVVCLFVPKTCKDLYLTDGQLYAVFIESKIHLDELYGKINGIGIYYVGPQSDLLGPNGEELYPGVKYKDKLPAEFYC